MAQSFFVRFRYNPGLDLSVVRMELCAMNPQKFGVKGVCRCADGDMELFVHLSGKILPCAQNRNVFFVNLQVYCLFFILFIAQSQKV